MEEKMDIGASVGFEVKTADGTVVASEEIPQEVPKIPTDIKYVEYDIKLKILEPIKLMLDAQIQKMNMDPVDVYSSLVHDGFKNHFHRMCPYCGDSKIKWLEEAKHKQELTVRLKALKEKRIKKMQKEARKRNRGR